MSKSVPDGTTPPPPKNSSLCPRPRMGTRTNGPRFPARPSPAQYGFFARVPVPAGQHHPIQSVGPPASSGATRKTSKPSLLPTPHPSQMLMVNNSSPRNLRAPHQKTAQELAELTARGLDLALSILRSCRSCRIGMDFSVVERSCRAMRLLLGLPDDQPETIRREGIVFAVKDLIFVFMRISSAWQLIRNYAGPQAPPELASVRAALDPRFDAGFARWQESTRDFLAVLLKSFGSAEKAAQDEKRAGIDRLVVAAPRQPWIGRQQTQPDEKRDCIDPLLVAAPRPPWIGEQQRQPWIGEQQPQPWIGEQKRQPWIGEQQSQPWIGEQQLQPWIGEQQPQPWIGEQQPQPWIGEQQPQPWIGEQKRQPWIGEQQPQPWIGEQKRQPWMGEQQSLPWIGEQQFQPWFGEQQPQPWIDEQQPQPGHQHQRQRPKPVGHESVHQRQIAHEMKTASVPVSFNEKPFVAQSRGPAPWIPPYDCNGDLDKLRAMLRKMTLTASFPAVGDPPTVSDTIRDLLAKVDSIPESLYFRTTSMAEGFFPGISCIAPRFQDLATINRRFVAGAYDSVPEVVHDLGQIVRDALSYLLATGNYPQLDAIVVAFGTKLNGFLPRGQ